jgi:pimeloyl-ACP methyl ester carboxylesterase
MIDDPEQVKMFEEGNEWRREFFEYSQEVTVNSCGFRLVGEYYDFGYDKAVIIIPGRMETLQYSCYFAAQYPKSGYNVLVIDNRSHGLSEGKYNCLGYREYADILKWGELLHDEFGINCIVCHGICIGAATALYAMVREDCPAYFKGLVADGMFTTFRDSFTNHLIKDKRPKFPTVFNVMTLISLHSKANAFKDGPITRIDHMCRPILFLYSLQDKFSLPEQAQKLYEKCPSKKKLVWFEKGVHSHLRINAQQKYDESIADFLEEEIGG